MRTALKRLILMRGGFSPTSIPGLQLWLDASDASTLFQNSDATTAASANGDVVGYWGDKSGNGLHALQASTPNKPTLRTNVKNGRNVIRFDGSNDFLDRTVSTLAQPYTLVAVNLCTEAGSTLRTIVGGRTGAFAAMYYDAAGSLKLYTSVSSQISSPGSLRGQWNVSIAVANGESSLLRNNGAQVASGDASTGAINLYEIGRNSTNLFLGDIAEVLIYNRRLETSEMQALEVYLDAKWAVY